MDGITFSGLKGKALSLTTAIPDSFAVQSIIPTDCFKPEMIKSLRCLMVLVVGTGLCTAFGFATLPVLDPTNLLTLLFWMAYSAMIMIVAMGMWVLGHKCRQGAFSKDKKLQDSVSYVLHSLFLVPYYLWQCSHPVHHWYTNHMELSKTHIPEDSDMNAGKKLYDSIKLRRGIMDKFGNEDGIKVWGAFQAMLHLIIGWPIHLLMGATGNLDRGMMNHYFPYPVSEPKQSKKELFSEQHWCGICCHKRLVLGSLQQHSRDDSALQRSLDCCQRLVGPLYMVSFLPVSNNGGFIMHFECLLVPLFYNHAQSVSILSLLVIMQAPTHQR